MTYGISLRNDSGYLTFSDDKTYYVFKEKLNSGNAGSFSTTDNPSWFYWDTTYTGASIPIVFIYSDGMWASVINTRRLSNNKWRISIWTEGDEKVDTQANLTGYLFVNGDEVTTNPSYGVRINDANGNKIFDSDYNIVNVKDFSTAPAPTNSVPSGIDAWLYPTSGAWGVESVNHGVSGLSKPAAMLYSNGFMIKNHSQTYYGSPVRTYQHSVLKITSTAIKGAWVHMGGNIFGTEATTMSSDYTTPIIDGGDYD